MKPLTVKLPDALRVRLEAEAARRGVSVGAVVREAAETYVVSSPTQKKLSAYELSKDICGSLDGGPGDLSTNPKYLEDLGLDSMGDSRYRPPGRVHRKKRKPAPVGH
jgi:hypothetical protein